MNDTNKGLATNPRANIALTRDLSELREIHPKNLDRSPQRLGKFRGRNPHLRNVLRVAGIDGTMIDGSRRDAGHFQDAKTGDRRIHGISFSEISR
jgi:hypothetical protein